MTTDPTKPDLYQDNPDWVVPVIRDRKGLEAVLNQIGDGTAAFDFETTGLDPSCCRVRLASIVNDDLQVIVDFDHIKGGFNRVSHLFSRGAWVVFNAAFEQMWFKWAGTPDVTLWDVGHLKRAVDGGGHMSLASMTLEDLGIAMDKSLQVSDWGREDLEPEQLAYAMDDSIITWALWKLWTERAAATKPGLSGGRTPLHCFDLLNDLVVPCEEMKEHGIVLDTERHATLVERWKQLHGMRAAKVRMSIPESEVANLNSRRQLSQFFNRILPDSLLRIWERTESTGDLKLDKDALRRMAYVGRGTPLEVVLDALIDYNKISTYISSFGQSLIDRALRSPEFRIHARYNIGAARTCRFSSSNPNLQQIPRDLELLGEETSLRRSFIAPPGYELVSLDYSGIELRMLALLSGDHQLLHDCVHGDVHLEVGSYWAGRRLDKSKIEDKRVRQDAKNVSFGIIYGSGAGGLAATMRTEMDVAVDLLEYWKSRYPAAFDYRYVMEQQASIDGYIHCIDGGTIYMGKKPELPKLANYPVQRAALSIMARAIYLHWMQLQMVPDAHLISTIHDALISEAPAGRQAEEVYTLMEKAMTQAYLEFFPGAPTDRLVEGGIGPNWGQLEDVQ